MYQHILYQPLPLRPTKRKSLNLATWFFIIAVALRSSAEKFSSFPAEMWTVVPSSMSPSETTLNATGRVLLQRQWDGNTLHTKFGESVLTSSPGYSANASHMDLSPFTFRGKTEVSIVVMVSVVWLWMLTTTRRSMHYDVSASRPTLYMFSQVLSFQELVT